MKLLGGIAQTLLRLAIGGQSPASTYLHPLLHVCTKLVDLHCHDITIADITAALLHSESKLESLSIEDAPRAQDWETIGQDLKAML